jgi:hypothetical protein
MNIRYPVSAKFAFPDLFISESLWIKPQSPQDYTADAGNLKPRANVAEGLSPK